MTTPVSNLDEARLRTLVERLPLVAYVDRIDDVSSSLYISPQIVDLTGYEPAEFVIDPGLYTRLVHPDDRDAYLESIASRASEERPASGAYRLVGRDGRVVWVNDHEQIVKAEDGTPLYAHGYLTDVTELRTARIRLEAVNTLLAAFSEGMSLEEVVRRALETLAAAIPGTRISYVELRPDGLFHVVESSKHPALLPVVGQTTNPGITPEYRAALERGEVVAVEDTEAELAHPEVAAAVAQGGVRSFADAPLRRNGELVGTLCVDAASPRRFPPSELELLREVAEQLAIVRDRDRAASELGRRDQILSTVSRAAAVLLAGSSWEDAAPGLLKTLGESVAASRAYVFEVRTRPDGRQAATQRFEWSAPGVSSEIANEAMQKMPFDDVGLEPLVRALDANEPIALAVRELSAKARALLEPQNVVSLMTVPIMVGGSLWGFVGFDDCEREREWSAAETDALRTAASLVAAAITRERDERALRENELKLGAVFEASLDAIFITSRDRRYVQVNAAAAELLGVSRDELLGRLVDDFLPPHRLATLLDDWADFETRETVGEEWELMRPDGGIVHVEASARPNFVAGLHIAFMRDITERKRLQAKALESQRLESMGRLAGGVAHDFNNLLTAIGGYSALILERSDLDEGVKEDLLEIQRAADRAAEVTRQLLAFGSHQVLRPIALDVGSVVADVESMLRRLIGEDVTLVTHLDPATGPVLADPAQLEQVVVNLVVNARDAMPSGGTLTISTYETGGEGARRVAVEVADTGTGIDEAIRARIFEPFFSTREHGVGLGLASVYGIVTQTGGEIEVSSEPGRGTTFVIRFPRLDAPVTPAEPVRPPSTETGSETLLLVEDEDVVRALARRVLERHGYIVLEASNGHEAIGVAETHDGDIHLVLTDVVMPGLRGHEVADRIAASRPEVRVIFMSGYADEALLGRAAGGSEHFLEKPFSNAALAQKVREVLG